MLSSAQSSLGDLAMDRGRVVGAFGWPGAVPAFHVHLTSEVDYQRIDIGTPTAFERKAPPLGLWT